MKRQLIIASIAVITVALSACGGGDKAAQNQDNKQDVKPAPYPLDVCVVSGEKLGSMGEPVVLDHNGTEVRFCCDSCLPEFKKDPDKYVAMLKKGKAGEMNHEKHKP